MKDEGDSKSLERRKELIIVVMRPKLLPANGARQLIQHLPG